MLSFFAKQGLLISQTDNQLVFNNSSLIAVRKVLVFILLLVLGLDAAYLVLGQWSLGATLFLFVLTAIVGAFSNLQGSITISQYEVDENARCFAFNKNKKTKLQAYPYLMIREDLGSSNSYEKDPIPFFELFLTKKEGVLDKKTDFALKNIHVYERDLKQVAQVLKSLQSVTKRPLVFYKKDDAAIDADMNRLQGYYQEII